MAHELSIRADGKAEMAFTGKTPWHGLGQSVTKGASIGVWLKEAGMDWEAKEVPVLYHPDGGPMRAVSDSKVIYRADTRDHLGIVGAGYNVVQPRQVLEFFRDMTEEQGWFIHTAGVLRAGRKVWAMATNGNVGNVMQGKHGRGGGDQVICQVLCATSLDQSMKTIVKECETVVVCANTLARGLREGGRGIAVSHRSVFDEAAVKRALNLAPDAFNAFMRNARLMAETPIKLDEVLDVLEGIFGTRVKEKPARPKVQTSWLGDLSDGDAEEGDDQVVPTAVGRVLELFKGEGLGATKPGRIDTRWGLFNAVTQYVDHEMGRTDTTRIDSAWFGRGNKLKDAAYEALGESVA